MNQNTYKADFSRVSDNLVKPYQTMMEKYGFHYCPIFLCGPGFKAEFYGAKFDENHIAFEFEIPDALVRIQDYYNWTDLIYFTENPEEFHDSYDENKFPTLDNFADFVLNTTPDEDRVHQFTVEKLKYRWLRSICCDLSKLDELHNGSGGANKLKPLDFYRR